jgi:hypothetical protein
MTEPRTDQSDKGTAAQGNGVLPVLITFALLFVLSAAVWFVLDRIRVDELRTAAVPQAGAEHRVAAPGTKARTQRVAAQ